MHISADAPTIDIRGTEVLQIAYKGEPVVTFAMVDKVHQRPKDTAKRNFNDNRVRFVNDEDFAIVPVSQKDVFRTLGIAVPNRGLIVLTKRGYLKLTKPMNDDRAWEVQGEMIDRYFAAERVAPRLPTTAEAFANVFQMVAEQERRHTDNERRIDAITADVQLIKDTAPLTAKPQNTETITEARKRIGKKFGLPPRIINIVMGELAYSPRAFAMVKNSHEDAKGSSYTVWRIIDVTKLFTRFVGECRMVTATQATHPDIGGRFKLTGKGCSQ